ncbi:ATP-binding protein, partial [Candidatus Auribacterota bacterium]
RDAMKDKGGTFEITTKTIGKQLKISMKDSGKGMPKEVQEKIFEPFFTSGKKHGTGLGMPIVKKIIEAHKGELSFVSEEGKGTTFFITLPL